LAHPAKECLSVLAIESHPSAIERFERSLSAAVARFAAGLREAETGRAFGAGERRLVAFLGIEGLTDAACRDPDALSVADRERILERLSVEDRKMGRQARAARLGYDLNRHIALRRLMGLFRLTPQAHPDRRCSGRELNNRFRRGAKRSPRRPACARAAL
jgi:hypothetical protein